MNPAVDDGYAGVYLLLHQAWPYFTALITVALMVGTAGHAILYKQDTRAAVAWVGVIWLAPVVGSVVYVLLGINRVKRRALAQRGDDPPFYNTESGGFYCSIDSLLDALPGEGAHLSALATLVNGLTARPLLHGNHLTPLQNGDEAYPEMLAAIRNAQASISLTTFIFGNDHIGRAFVEALKDAVDRGVQVRVLVDAIGARYSFPSIVGPLRKARIPVARFMPTTLTPYRTPYMNLRSHRKILIVDGRVGFTGGMNIRKDNLVSENPPHPVQDLHFKVEGPVVRELQDVFKEDWNFATNEHIWTERWFPNIEPKGDAIARAITDGPDQDLDKLPLTLVGALSCARRSVRIATPYFLPDQTLIDALNVAAMRGVTVDLLLPEKNNLRMVQWACTAQLSQVLGRGVRLWYTPPPFDHTKLMVIDDIWVLMGSANWDPRSLRLNFECNVECYDPALAAQLTELLERKRAAARRIELDEIVARPLPLKLRDGVARLFTPYL